VTPTVSDALAGIPTAAVADPVTLTVSEAAAASLPAAVLVTLTDPEAVAGILTTPAADPEILTAPVAAPARRPAAL